MLQAGVEIAMLVLSKGKPTNRNCARHMTEQSLSSTATSFEMIGGPLGTSKIGAQ
jgi:hypothetical protein